MGGAADLAEHEDEFDALSVAPGPLQAGWLLDQVGCSMYDELRVGFEQRRAERYRSCLPPVRRFLALASRTVIPRSMASWSLPTYSMSLNSSRSFPRQ